MALVSFADAFKEIEGGSGYMFRYRWLSDEGVTKQVRAKFPNATDKNMDGPRLVLETYVDNVKIESRYNPTQKDLFARDWQVWGR